mmetsp:Transcript_10293/g.19476  ORF Transcript_10293/g.19476 Transcript_10293/m.19476 type:complete len:246 (-) Transcript_10293:282-1019(-)|eukprot:CAMPEP_0114236262 /NCGR_PEP_ID=MMETSP0058-20121206/6742_1 /TAXON_ID=36894 /ORGANISM="Pyramimonas parkeae, CCMP726" /LENGTH=245 /DNA_ID=CAMNT_0001348183 /DNA_START=257 /DNA_END=994 /DNA_ORIENTATION=+
MVAFPKSSQSLHVKNISWTKNFSTVVARNVGGLAASSRAPGRCGWLRVEAANVRQWKAARRMRLRVRDEHPHLKFEEYFQNAERVVNVTFPDKARREFLEPGKWRVRLLPIQFLFVNFQAVNTIQAWAVHDGMNLAVSDLLLEGAPPELELNEKLAFDLKGQMRVKRVNDLNGDAESIFLDGVVAMTLAVDIPAVFATAPGIDQLSQTIMDTILKNLEYSLVKGLSTDYRLWVAETESKQFVEAP